MLIFDDEHSSKREKSRNKSFFLMFLSAGIATYSHVKKLLTSLTAVLGKTKYTL